MPENAHPGNTVAVAVSQQRLDDGSNLLQPLAVGHVEGIETVAVDVDHCHYPALAHDGNHNLGARERRAGNVAREVVHIGHDERCGHCPGCATHPLATSYRVASGRALKHIEFQHIAIYPVKSHPQVVRKRVVEHGGDIGQSAHRVVDPAYQAGDLLSSLPVKHVLVGSTRIRNYIFHFILLKLEIAHQCVRSVHCMKTQNSTQAKRLCGMCVCAM